MAAGLGFKTFTTGEVLTAADVNGYLMQGVLVFANAAARDAAITSPQEGQACYLKDTDAVLTYSGSAWVGFDDSNAIQNSIVDAKGDLISATGNDTPARLAVGNNGETLVADSATSTGLRYNPTMAAGKNALINGAFDIWQRGTTFTNPSSSGIYTADRWTVYFNGNGTITQETSVKPDTSTYACKVTATASSADNSVYQLVEQLNMEQFRGKVVTLSVKVAGTATLAPSIGLAYSTTADSALTTTSTAISASIVSNPTINASTFVTYISQFTVPNTAKTLRIQLASGTMANTNVLYWAEAQLEIGSVATVFSRAGGTIQGELAACQRYYYRFNSTTANIYIGNGIAFSTTVAYVGVQYPVTMRIRPTALEQSGTAADYATVRANSSVDNCTSVPVYASTTTNQMGWVNLTSANLVAGNTTSIYTQSTNAYLGWSAEL